MKFAFCLFKYFPYGGLQRGFLQLARECIDRGHQVDVYTGSWDGEKPVDNLKVFIIPTWHLTNHRRYQAFARKVRRITAAGQYDAVVGFNKMPGLDIYFASDVCYAAKVKKKNFLYRISSRCRVLSALERSVFDKNSKTRIISISETTKKQYMEYYGTEENRFYSVPPGISRKRIALADTPGLREEWRNEFKLGPDDYVVLMVGSGFRTKGVDRAIKAIACLPPSLKEKTMLVIVGKGKKSFFLRLAKKLRVAERVIFTGERDDVPRFFAGADLLLHPAYHETAGAVLIEAMAAGLPVLVTDTCGYAFHVQKADAGKLVPSPFSQETLNTMLVSMLGSQKTAQWSANGKKYVKETDVSGRHEKAADVIEAVATRRNPL
ncbi:MAG: glycosyltransferase family 4 protein [Desulfobacteraceae bacterium]